MSSTQYKRSLLLGVAALSVATVTLFTPVSFSFDDHGFALKSSAAFAKDGEDDDDDDDRSGSSHDDDEDEDDDHGGSGHDDDEDDDHGGSGDDDDDDHDDDHGGNGNDDDDDDDRRGSLTLEEFLASLQSGTSIAKAERSGDSIEIVYSDGWKEEIENGIYELKDPNNNTIIERPATAEDIARLSSAF